MNNQNAAGMTVGLRRTLIALVTVVAVVMAAAFGMKQVPTANADTVDVTISDVTITKQAEPGDENPNIVKGNNVSVSMNWAANAPFKADDTFEVAFPETFKPQAGTEFDLKDEGGVVGGTCSVANGAQTLVCTLNNAFQEKDNVKGVIELRAQAEKANTEESYPFTVNGNQERTVSANVPGGVKDQGKIDKYNPVDQLEKSAHIAGLSDEYLLWNVLIPYDSFAGSDQIVIRDTLTSDNHKHINAIEPVQGEERRGASQRNLQNQTHPVNPSFEILNNGKELAVTIKPLKG